jgi:glucose-1-phosphate cytidylyltransferase
MKIYAAYGVHDFIICCGYKGYVIKEYFQNYFLHMSDVTFDMTTNEMHVHTRGAEPWKVTLLDTGDASMTGGRLLRAAEYVKNEKEFLLTYGDGLANVDVGALIAFHRAHGKAATLTATFPPGRFGALDIVGDQVRSFKEKPAGDGARINGGFFVLSPKVLSYLKNDATVWEQEPLSSLAADGELMSFAHDGFWQPMDTLRDKQLLESLWEQGQAPWKVWA